MHLYSVIFNNMTIIILIIDIMKYLCTRNYSVLQKKNLQDIWNKKIKPY